MAIPLEHVKLSAITRHLTVRYTPMGAEEATIVEGYTISDGYIHVPRQYGLTFCNAQGIPFEDHTSAGSPVSFPRVPSPRDYQAHILDQIVERFDSFYDFIFKAHTGWGKTIGSLIVAARLGVTTLIIVDQENLMKQWVDALDQHFGMTIENGHVGIVQGKKCNFEGKSVVIAMLQTSSRKTLPQALYDWPGYVIVDEVHTAGAPTYLSVLADFSAGYRNGVSATPKRKDALQKLLEYHMGKVRVSADKEHDESAVYIADHETTYSWYGNTSPKIGRIVNEVTDDGSRNLLLAEITLSLYETGRDTLFLSDRTEQLKHIESLLYYMGAGSDITGIYAGSDPPMKYAKNTTPMRPPNDLIENDDTGEGEYTPVSLQLIAKKIPKKRLAFVKANAGILLATYGMCAKGFDEPRLRAGVDGSPRSEVEQIHGRILREVPGSKMPIWATIRDTRSYRLMYSFSRRIGGYLKSNGRMYQWQADGSLLQWHETEVIEEALALHAELKTMRIVTRRDGRHTLLTPSQEKARKRQAVTSTVRTIRSRRPV